MAFRRPAVPPGAVADLFHALHDLHLRSGEPSAAVVAKGLGLSRSTVHHVFSRPAVPRWGPFELVVEKLCEITGDDPKKFQDLWIGARAAERGRAGEILTRAAAPAHHEYLAPVQAGYMPDAKVVGWTGPPALSQVRLALPYEDLGTTSRSPSEPTVSR